MMKVLNLPGLGMEWVSTITLLCLPLSNSEFQSEENTIETSTSCLKVGDRVNVLSYKTGQSPGEVIRINC